MQIFLILVICFIIIVLLSFIPLFKKIFVSCFESQQFRAIRFIIALFGILGVILGFFKWYASTNPMSIQYEATYQIFGPSMEKGEQRKERSQKCLLAAALQDVIHNCFAKPFINGWQPIYVRVGKRHDRMFGSLSEEKGELVDFMELANRLKVSLEPCGLATSRFYLPPKAEIEISIKNDGNKFWAELNVENDDFLFSAVMITSGLMANVRTEYIKKGLFEYLFNEYDHYDRWHWILIQELGKIQEIHRDMIYG